MENFWNINKWNICFIVEWESLNRSFEWCDNWFFNLLSFWNLINWNIFNSFNINRFIWFASDWFVLISINLNDSFVYIFFSWCYWFIWKDWMISFWNCSQWNILLSINTFECSSYSFSFWFNSVWGIYSFYWLFNWNKYFFINKNRCYFFISNWLELLLINCNNNFWSSF